MIRIITDSASDYTVEQAEKENIILAPMTIYFGEESFRDKYEITGEQFYERLVAEKELPKTSQINPYAFQQLFKEVTEAGDEALVILMSSELSGTYQSAMNAADDFDNIYVVDTLNVTVGERCLISLAQRLIEEGKSAKEIAEILDQKKHDVCVLALLDTLEYLKKGGRISATVAFAGGVLSIKPVVTVVEGKVEILGKARGSKNGSNMLKEKTSQTGVDYDLPIFLGYSGLDQGLLNQYVEDSKELWEGKVEDLPVILVGSTIGTHVGPGAIVVAFFRK